MEDVSKILFSNQKETCKHNFSTCLFGSLFQARLVLKIIYFQDKLLEKSAATDFMGFAAGKGAKAVREHLIFPIHLGEISSFRITS